MLHMPKNFRNRTRRIVRKIYHLLFVLMPKFYKFNGYVNGTCQVQGCTSSHGNKTVVLDKLLIRQFIKLLGILIQTLLQSYLKDYLPR